MSSLGYIISLAAILGRPFDEFYLYFDNYELGKLDMALSEFRLRDDFCKVVGSFYNHNVITCVDELEWLLYREVKLETARMDFTLPSKFYSSVTSEKYTNITLCMIGGYDEGELYDRLARVSPHLTTVSGKHITSIGLRALGWMCGATLTTLNFDTIEANEHDQQLSFQRCPLLKVLKVIWPYFRYSPHSLLAFADCCPHLETLTLSECFLTTELVAALNSLTVRSLYLSCCHQSEYLAGSNFFTSFASVNLECLVLDYAKDYAYDATIQSIASCCPNLKSFSLINTVLDNVSAASIECLSRAVYTSRSSVSRGGNANQQTLPSPTTRYSS